MKYLYYYKYLFCGNVCQNILKGTELTSLNFALQTHIAKLRLVSN